MSSQPMEIAQYNQATLVRPDQMELTVEEIVTKVAKVRQVAQSVMKDGVHFGTIPGTPKPTLYKAGGEILCLTFRLAPKYEKEIIDLGNGHREYSVRCDLFHIQSGAFFGSGVGSCSTMESKYRYRPGPVESTGHPVPKEYWDYRKSDPKKAQELIGGKGFSAKKIDGSWLICRAGEVIENPNIADCYNTALKIGAKRAYLDAVLKATAASEVYTQDLKDEDDEDDEGSPDKPAPIQQPQRKSEAQDANGKLINEKQISRLWSKAYALNLKDKAAERKLVDDILATYGYQHADKVKVTDYDAIIAWIEKGQVPSSDPEPGA